MRLSVRVRHLIVVMSLALLGVTLVAVNGTAASGAQKAAGSVLYTGRGKGVKEVSFRLKGHKLIEATIVFVESCTVTGGGHGRRYRSRTELEQASPRYPLRVNTHGRFHLFRSEVYPSSDEYEEFAGTVTPRSIIGGITSESNESAPESGVFNGCKTGPFGGPRSELTFHAWRRPGDQHPG